LIFLLKGKGHPLKGECNKLEGKSLPLKGSQLLDSRRAIFFIGKLAP
jgi:hypothetical protein